MIKENFKNIIIFYIKLIKFNSHKDTESKYIKHIKKIIALDYHVYMYCMIVNFCNNCIIGPTD